MNKILEFALKFTGDTADAKRQVEDLKQKTAELGNEVKKVGTPSLGGTGAANSQIQDLKRQTKDLGQALDKVGSEGGLKALPGQFNAVGVSISSLKGLLVGLAEGLVAGLSVAGVVAFTRSVFDAGLAGEKLANQLKYVTGSAVGAAQELSYLREAANRIGLDFTTAAGAYAKFAAAAKGTALEGGGARQVFEALGKASTVMGLSTEETNGALLAVSQMLSKGTVAAEELRGQLGERLPGAFAIAARSMGVTTSELGKMLEQGEIVASDFLPRFARELEASLGDAPQSSAQSAQAQLNRLNSSWDLFKQNLSNSGFLTVAANSLNILAAGVQSVNTSIDAKVASGFSELERLKLLQAGELANGETDQAAKTSQMIVDTRRRIAALQDEAKAAGEAADAKRKALAVTGDGYDIKEAGRARAVIPEDKSAAIEALKNFTDKYRSAAMKSADAVAEYKRRVAKAGELIDPDTLARIKESFAKKGGGADNAAFSELKAAAESEMKLLQVQLSQAGEAYQRAYDQRLIGVRDYYTAQAAIQDKALAAQQTAIERELAQAGASGKNRAEAIRLEGELAVVIAKRGQVAFDANYKTSSGLEKLKEELAAVRLQLAETMGNATPEQLAESVRARYKVLLEEAKVNAADVPGAVDLIEKTIDVETAKKRLGQIKSEWERVIGPLSAEEQRINILRENGLLSEIDARQQIVELQRAAGVKLQEQLPMLDELAAKFPYLATQIAEMRNEWMRLSTVTDEWANTFNGATKTALATFLTEATTGAKTFGQAALDALTSIRNKMLSMAAEDLAGAIFKSANSGSGGGLWGFIANLIPGYSSGSGSGSGSGSSGFLGNGISLKHTGGLIGAPGLWRSGLSFSPEQIAAAPRFHRGGMIGSDERLLVGKVGEEVLTANDPRHSNNGGGIQSIKAEIYNSGTPQKITGADMQFDLKGAVLRIMTEDLNGNGSYSRSSERTYGLNRAAGAF